MKPLTFILSFLVFSASLQCHQTEIYAGPHFNYMRMNFMRPADIEGYAGGITTGARYTHSYFRGSLNFEGTWNAGPLTGKPNERSFLYESFLDLNVGPHFRWQCWQFDPYTGFGWDHLNHKLNPSTLRSLSFQYDKLFIPIGFYLHWIRNNFNLGLQFEFRPDVYKNLNLLSTNLDPKWGYAFRSQLFLKQRFPFCWGDLLLSFVPFFDWSQFGNVEEKNSVGATLKIPRLLYWKVGLRVTLSAAF